MTELPHIDMDADADMGPVPTTVKVPLDEDTDTLVPPKKLVAVKAVEVDVEALNKQVAQGLRIVSPAENQLADDLQTGNFTWKIENWSKIDQPIVMSDTFVIAGYKWRVLLELFRKSGHEYLSLFLDVADSAELPLGWSRSTSYSFAVVNQSNPKLTKKKSVRHDFNQHSTNFGFLMFLPVEDLYDPKKGFLVKDSLIIQTEVDMRKVEHFSSYAEPYDSKKETGFVGLKNQGATSYLNSLIPYQGLRIVSPAEDQSADDLQTGNFTWKIENWSKIDRPPISDTFMIAGYKWRVLLELFRKSGHDYLSLFLGVADSAELPLGWSRSTSYSFAVVNQLNPKLTKKKHARHDFNQHSTNFGFFMFLPVEDLYDPKKGFLVKDSLIIQTEVDMRKVGHFLSYAEPYDSKKETGFVGLKNQGATCYLNSLIQTLYHLPCFRKAVYHMPTSRNDLLSESIPLALQTLFYNIQCADTSPGTEDLTKSFGWDTSQSFRQEDVHEFNLFLCGKLEKEMKGTLVDGTIQELFEGHFISYIECIDVAYTSSRTESFYDLQLDVKGCKDVYGSFDKYVEVDKLEGENQYRTEQFGLQDARKGAKFIDLPPVLQLQLKRFQFDSNQDRMVKINDRYEFPLQLDLDREHGKYMSPEASQRVRNLYTLHSVLVHSGASINGGHYYAFIRPTLFDQWYKFNDDLVTKEEPKTVFEEHFGGEAEGVPQHTVEFNPEFTNSPSKFTKHSNAYMLVYVRECDREKVMCSVDQEDISKHLQVRLKEEEEEEERERKRKNTEAQSYTVIRVSIDEDLEKQIGKDIHFDLVDHNKVRKFRIKKLAIFKQLRDQVAKDLGISPNRLQRFWLWSEWGNRTYRVDRPVTEEEELLQVFCLQEKRPAFNGTGEVLNLFLEVLRPDVDPGVQPTASEVLLFLKLYIPETKELMYKGKIFVKVTERPIDILETLNRMAGFVPHQDIQLYKEVAFRPHVICDHIDKQMTFGAIDLKNGDIICYQKTLSREEAERCSFPDVPSYFEYVHNRRFVIFRLLEKPHEDCFCLELSNQHTYPQVAEKVAEKLGLKDASKIRLTSHNGAEQKPVAVPIKYRVAGRLRDMLKGCKQKPSDDMILYFEIVDSELQPMPGIENSTDRILE